MDPRDTATDHARIFDASSNHWSGRPLDDKVFLQCQMNWMQDKMNAEGFVFLNDVYQALGFPRTGTGQLVGWHKERGDGVVHFDIVERADGTFLVDFNVDGIIWDKL